MGVFTFAQRIASDTACAQGGMMDRAAHLVCHLSDYRNEVVWAERRRVIDAILWFRNVEKFTAEDVLARVLDGDK